LLKHSKQIFKKGFIELSDEPFESIYSMLKHLPALIKIRFDRSVYQTVNKYLNNKNLNEALSMHPLLVGGNPYSTTSIYLLIQYLEWKWGVYYAEGGTGRIIDGLEKLLIKKDVNIKKNTEAKKIILKNNKVVGIDTSQGIIDCDIVVCNSDPTYTYNNLLGLKIKKQKKINFHKGIFYKPETIIKIRNKISIISNIKFVEYLIQQGKMIFILNS